VWGRKEMHTGLLCGNLKEGDHLEDLDVDEMIKLILNTSAGGRLGLNYFGKNMM
jgi:hypothetical protein